MLGLKRLEDNAPKQLEAPKEESKTPLTDELKSLLADRQAIIQTVADVKKAQESGLKRKKLIELKAKAEEEVKRLPDIVKRIEES